MNETKIEDVPRIERLISMAERLDRRAGKRHRRAESRQAHRT